MGQVDATGAEPNAVDGTSNGATGTNYGVYGTDASASGYGGYFTNTNSGDSLLTEKGTVILGAGGTAFSDMGTCSVSSFTPSTGNTNVTCTGVPASTSVAVTCSASAPFSTLTGNGLISRATGTASQIAVSILLANTTAVTLKCAWVQPAYGYFVMSKTTYTGNLGGDSGADAKCLTDLTTNTGWKGYTDANARGLLTSSHVHAFGVCTSANGTTNLKSNTQYIFADANNSANGGASFTTNGSGMGPGDSANWFASDHFGADYLYWTNIGTGTGTLWDGTQCMNSAGAACNDFSNGGNGYVGPLGEFANGNTGTNRWESATPLCNTTQHLVCYVNP